MAFPFGGHPTLKRLLEWLTEQGCKSEIVFRINKQGRTYQALQIVNPKGGKAVIVEPDFDEFLAPSMVSYFQRRLCIKTPFAAQPELTLDNPKEPE
jgi:hypothetical protein